MCPGPVEHTYAWLLENRLAALRYGRRGFIIQFLLHRACIFLVAGQFDQDL